MSDASSTRFYRRLSTQNINLLKENQVPPHMREVAILSGYRSPHSSMLDCALSIFMATNETLNFWTHFIPSFYFLWQLFTLWDMLQVITDPYTWPFTAYMLTVCLYPLISALAHTFFSVSAMARHTWFFMDYGALNFYGFGCGLLYKAYVFPEDLHNSAFGSYFLEILLLLCVIGTLSACYSRFIDNVFYVKMCRLGAFALPWVWDSIPLIYRLLYNKDLNPAASEHYLLQFLFSFLIGFFYASHFPERLAPGKFDFVGNSHQLLHICGVLATYHQMRGALIDMEQRRDALVAGNLVLPPFWSIEAVAFQFGIITFAIVFFVFYAQQYEYNLLKIDKKTKFH